MRKLAAWFFICVGTALLVVSTSGDLMLTITRKREALHGWAGVHPSSGAGDLVSLGYLDDTKQFYEEKKYVFKRPADTSAKNIDLYVYGDSYIMDVPDSAFAHVNRYHFGRRDYADLRYTLDSHKKNILILEDAERFIRIYFQYFGIFDHLKKADPVGAFCPDAPTVNEAFLGIPISHFFNPGINQNLEFNLWGYHFLDKIKLFKASATYSLFHRAMGDVVLSEDGHYLFMRQTVAAHDPLSCYEVLNKTELSLLTEHLDSIYRHYRQEGFDEVYLSFIPNPASILQPRYYNHLIPDLTRACALKHIPVIDIYPSFAHSSNPGELYRLGDTHWNNNGLQVWIGGVNKILDTYQ